MYWYSKVVFMAFYISNMLYIHSQVEGQEQSSLADRVSHFMRNNGLHQWGISVLSWAPLSPDINPFKPSWGEFWRGTSFSCSQFLKLSPIGGCSSCGITDIVQFWTASEFKYSTFIVLHNTCVDTIICPFNRVPVCWFRICFFCGLIWFWTECLNQY